MRFWACLTGQLEVFTDVPNRLPTVPYTGPGPRSIIQVVEGFVVNRNGCFHVPHTMVVGRLDNKKTSGSSSSLLTKH